MPITCSLITIKHKELLKTQEALLDNRKEVGLEVNAKKSMYMVMSHRDTIAQNHYMQVSNKSFENEAKFKLLGMMVRNQNCAHEEIKSRLNLGNACYHAVQNLIHPI
jgi:hypothetical protein